MLFTNWPAARPSGGTGCCPHGLGHTFQSEGAAVKPRLQIDAQHAGMGMVSILQRPHSRVCTELCGPLILFGAYHELWLDPHLELLICQIAQLEGSFLQGCSLLMRLLGNRSCLVIPDLQCTVSLFCQDVSHSQSLHQHNPTKRSIKKSSSAPM